MRSAKRELLLTTNLPAAAIIRWPNGLAAPAEVFPLGGSDETDQLIRQQLLAILKDKTLGKNRREGRACRGNLL
jgi:hypothetical protein